MKFLLLILLGIFSLILCGQEELLVKRKENFSFSQKPIISKGKESAKISFTCEDYCDVTIGVEDGQGQIIRHLASGVLGSNAPLPFQKNSLSQTIIWDYKDNSGEYVKNIEDCHVFVHLGIKPVYDKSLLWHPNKRQGNVPPIMQKNKDGMVVYDGGSGIDFIKMYRANGDYIKTIYPFSNNHLPLLRGLVKHTFPDGQEMAVKPTYLKQTFLTSGNYYGYEKRAKDLGLPEGVELDHHSYGRRSRAASFLAVTDQKIVIGDDYLFRFLISGKPQDFSVDGPAVALLAPVSKKSRIMRPVAPKSGAIAADGKTLYLTGYHFCYYGVAGGGNLITTGDWHTFHGVMKVSLEGNDKPELFLGSKELDQSSRGDDGFNVPIHVAVDQNDMIYVSDYLNDRVQIFSQEKKLVRSLNVPNPSQVCIDEKNEKIYVISSVVFVDGRSVSKKDHATVKALVTVFDQKSGKQVQVYELPKELVVWPAPVRYYNGYGPYLNAQVISDDKGSYLWFAIEWTDENNLASIDDIKHSGIQIYQIKNTGLDKIRDFREDVNRVGLKNYPAKHNRQRLYTNPKTGLLYVAECFGSYHGKSFKDLIEVNPQTSLFRTIPVPFDAEDMTIDHNGYFYFRSLKNIIRCRLEGDAFVEIPWDYGNEVEVVHTGSTSHRKESKSISALELPSTGGWHHGGIYVGLNGNLVVSFNIELERPNKYQIQNFRGRSMGGRGGVPMIFIYDKHGKLIVDDALPGFADNAYGLGMDKENNITIMLPATRVYQGNPYPFEESGTLMKFKPKVAKIISSSAKNDLVPLGLGAGDRLDRSYDLKNSAYGDAWVENSEWLFGGVGWSGKNPGVGCSCWNAKFAYDYYDRSFAPEINRFSVAIIDRAGNLMMRVGTAGNVDDGEEAKEKKSSLVPIMHGAYLGTLTDRYLFIADPANQNISCVSLEYHTKEKISLNQ